MSKYVNRLVPASIGTVVQDGRVLLLKRRNPPYAGFWTLPGGKVEVGEHPHTAMLREFQEETGLATRIGRFCGVVSEVHAEAEGPSHFLLYLFRLELEEGQSLVQGEEGELAWFHPEALTSRQDVADIDRWFVQHLLLEPSGSPLVISDTRQGGEQEAVTIRVLPS